jgi:hypothetical protein
MYRCSDCCVLRLRIRSVAALLQFCCSCCSRGCGYASVYTCIDAPTVAPLLHRLRNEQQLCCSSVAAVACALAAAAFAWRFLVAALLQLCCSCPLPCVRSKAGVSRGLTSTNVQILTLEVPPRGFISSGCTSTNVQILTPEVPPRGFAVRQRRRLS